MYKKKLSLKNKQLICLIVLLLPFMKLWSQDSSIVPNDSLRKIKYWYLENKIYKHLGDSNNDSAKFYSKLYLRKAIEIKDTLNLAKGFLFLASSISDVEKQIQHLEKSIHLSKQKPNFLVPCTSYSVLGGVYDSKNNHKKALDNYLLAHKAADVVGNSMLSLLMKENISIIKSSIGEYEAALKYSNDLWNNIKNDHSSNDYLDMLFSRSYRHAHLKNLDSARYYNELGVNAIKRYNKPNRLNNKFIYLQGLIYYYDEDFRKALSKLKSSLNTFEELNDNQSLASTYFFVGNSYMKINEIDKGVEYLKKMDSIFVNHNLLLPYCRKGYQLLISHYKNKNNIQDQLNFTNRLISFDSLINANYKSLSKTIYEKFEIPNTINEKEILIERLKETDNKKGYFIYFLILVIILSILGLVYNYNRRKKEAEKLKNLIAEIEDEKESDQKETKESDYTIDKELVSKILLDLEKFELRNDFLNKNLSLASLAKKCNTNQRYLSNIINQSKKKSFRNYINDLRIDYVIEQLEKNSELKKYSIEGIANEVGFKTGRAFSNAFKKKTGKYPSVYVNDLKE